MKKILLLTALIGLLLVLLSGTAGAETGGQAGACRWTLDDAGTLTISGNGMLQRGEWDRAGVRNVKIEKGVTGIDRDVFSYCGNLESVVIPEGVTGIGMMAFYQCENLVSVNLPQTLERIGDSAFCQCRKLAGIRLPESLRTIEGNAFSVCESLTEITFPKSITVMDNSLFTLCSGLTEVNLPEGLVNIGYNCFAGCKGLTHLEIPSTVRYIGGEAFAGCTNLTGLKLPGGLTRIGIHAFSACKALGTLDIPDSVTEISRNAFSEDFDLIVGPNTPAHQYAEREGIRYILRGQGGSSRPGPASTVEERIRQVVAAEIRDGMSSYQKAMALHNWLSKNVDYDYSFSSISYTAEGPLLHGKAVCSGFTIAYLELLKAAGIESVKAYGTDHNWNMVNLDGTWCHIDVTWDEGGSKEFFAVTDEALAGVESHENTNPSHACTDYRISFAYQSGLMQDTARSWTEEMASHIQAGETSFTLQFREVGSKGCTERMTARMVSDAGVTVNGRYYPVDAEYQILPDNSTVNYHISFRLKTGDPNYAGTSVRTAGHTLAWQAGQEITCAAGGTEPCWKCTDCGKLFSGTGALLEIAAPVQAAARPHQLTFTTYSAPSCTRDGNDPYYTCSKCGQVFADRDGFILLPEKPVLPAKGHSGEWVQYSSEQHSWYITDFYTRTCTVCGMQDTKYVNRSQAELPGDANNDGVYDGRDAVRLMNYLSDPLNVTISVPNADVFVDGTLSEDDLRQMMKELAGEAG